MIKRVNCTLFLLFLSIFRDAFDLQLVGGRVMHLSVRLAHTVAVHKCDVTLLKNYIS